MQGLSPLFPSVRQAQVPLQDLEPERFRPRYEHHRAGYIADLIARRRSRSGSTAEKALEESKCSILAVKPEGFEHPLAKDETPAPSPVKRKN